MPTLPRIDERPTPSPVSGMSRVTGTGIDTYGGQALESAGKSMFNLSEVIREEKRKNDQIVVEDSINKLREEQNQLTYGDNGFLKKRGADAVTTPIYEDYNKIFEIKSNALEDKLDADQKELFRKNRDVVRLHFGEGILRHVVQERENYRKLVFQNTIETEGNIAQSQHNDPNVISMSLVRVSSLANAEADRLGLPDAGDPSHLREDFIKEAQGKVHQKVLEGMLNADNYVGADEYLKANKANLDSKFVAVAEKTITQGKTYQEVDRIWDNFAPKDINAPVLLFNMEQEARKTFANNPEGLRIALQDLRTRKDAYNQQQAEVNASNHAAVLKAYEDGAVLKNIKKMPEFMALSGTEQERISSYITDRGYALSQRAKADKNSENNIEAWSEYYTITHNDPSLAGLNEDQIMAMAPRLGMPIVHKLMSIKRDVNNPLAVTIDKSVFVTVLSENDIDPYPKDSPKKAAIGRFENAVREEIGRIQQVSKKKLTQEEITNVARKMADKKVMYGRFFPDEEIASMVKPEKVKDIYVPMEQIPETEVVGLINIMRSNGAIPEKMKDAEARNKFADKIQKAYGRYVAGASQSVVMEALK